MAASGGRTAMLSSEEIMVRPEHIRPVLSWLLISFVVMYISAD